MNLSKVWAAWRLISRTNARSEVVRLDDPPLSPFLLLKLFTLVQGYDVGPIEEEDAVELKLLQPSPVKVEKFEEPCYDL